MEARQLVKERTLLWIAKARHKRNCLSGFKGNLTSGTQNEHYAWYTYLVALDLLCFACHADAHTMGFPDLKVPVNGRDPPTLAVEGLLRPPTSDSSVSEAFLFPPDTVALCCHFQLLGLRGFSLHC